MLENICFQKDGKLFEGKTVQKAEFIFQELFLYSLQVLAHYQVFLFLRV